MEENLYQSTRNNIEKKCQEEIAQAEARKADALDALEKLRPYWEEIATPEDVPSSHYDIKNDEDSITSAAVIPTGGQRSNFPDKVRTIIRERYSLGDEITQPALYEKLLLRFPEETKEIESNVRSRISKALKRQAKNGILKFIGKSESLGNPHIFQKIKQEENGNGNLLNFDEESAKPQPSNLFDTSELSVSNNENFQKNYDFVLIAEVRKIVAELNGREFTPDEIFETLQERFPNEVKENRRKSVSSTVNNLRIKGELIKIRNGGDGVSPIYQAKTEMPVFTN